MPQNVVDPEALIAANPCTQGAGSEFTITGKGGVPPNPNDVLSNDSSQFNWVEPSAAKNSATDAVTDLTDRLPMGSIGDGFLPGSYSREVIPAQGWVMDAQGQVTLVAYNSGGGASARVPKAKGACVPR